MQFTQKRRAVK